MNRLAKKFPCGECGSNCYGSCIECSDCNRWFHRYFKLFYPSLKPISN